MTVVMLETRAGAPADPVCARAEPGCLALRDLVPLHALIATGDARRILICEARDQESVRQWLRWPGVDWVFVDVLHPLEPANPDAAGVETACLVELQLARAPSGADPVAAVRRAIAADIVAVYLTGQNRGAIALTGTLTGIPATTVDVRPTAWRTVKPDPVLLLFP